jgi:hypothetical protein
MSTPVEFAKVADELARALVADIMESLSFEEIRQLIEEIEAKRRKSH